MVQYFVNFKCVTNQITHYFKISVLLFVFFTLSSFSVLSNEKCFVYLHDQRPLKKVELSQKDLPDQVQKHILEAYSDGVFKKGYKFVTPDGELQKYEVHIEQNGKELIIQYDEKGAPLKIEEP